MIKLLEIKTFSKNTIFPVQALCFEYNRKQLTLEIINIHTGQIVSTIKCCSKDADNFADLYTAITSFIACSPSNLAVLEMIDKGEQVDIKFNVLETYNPNIPYHTKNSFNYKVEMTIFKKDLTN